MAGNSPKSLPCTESSCKLPSPENSVAQSAGGNSLSLLWSRMSSFSWLSPAKTSAGNSLSLLKPRSSRWRLLSPAKASAGNSLSLLWSRLSTCSWLSMGSSKSPGNTFKRFWLSDKTLKFDKLVNVSDSNCCKSKRPRSKSCRLFKEANTLLGKTNSGFPESENRCKLLEEVKASSATLVMFCSLKLTSLKRRAPTRPQFARCFAPSSFWRQLHGKQPKSVAWIG